MYTNKLFKSPAFYVGLFIVIGAALRVGGMFGPLTHDELSAICRLQYDSLADVLTYGVKLGDTHPGGVQVLMWLWAQLFGTSAFAIRLPFVLMGIATIPLIYAIGRQWYGEWSALMPAAVIAVSQYTVYYSILARPYCIGLFFILCALFFLTRYVKKKKYPVLNLVMFAIFEASCAYTHYFCSLTALIMACGALFFVGRHHILPYLAACLGAVLLFLPHLRITLYQLFEYKGIGGWLGAPTPMFPLEYLRYLTHHSLIAAGVAAISFAMLFSLRTARQNLPLLSASLSVAILPFLIGYLYSVLVNPVLQFSVLIFAFPFLLLALAGFVRNEYEGWRTSAIAGVYVTTMVATLFFSRRHFSMLQREWVEASVNMAQDAIDNYGKDNVSCLFAFSPEMVSYYGKTMNLISNKVLKNEATLDSALSQCTSPYIVCAGIQDPNVIYQIHRHYPSLIQLQPRVVSEIFLFSKDSSDKSININKLAANVIDRPLSSLDGEFQNILDTCLADLIESRFNCIESQLFFHRTDSIGKTFYLVTELVCRGKRIAWREAHYPSLDGLEKIILPLRIESFIKHRSQLKHTRIKIYLWNPEGATDIYPDSCHISIIPTSPWMYSVLEEI